MTIFRKPLTGTSAELVNNLDLADDVRVEVVQIFGRNPQLQDCAATGLLNRVASHEVTLDLKSRYVPSAVVLNVPVSRDLDCVVLVEDRIEDRLLWKAGWPKWLC